MAGPHLTASPLRVAQIAAAYPPCIGGVETHVRGLAGGLAAAGDHVTVLTHQPGGAPPSEWMGAVRVLRFPLTVSAPNYRLSVALLRYLRSHRADFDIVHAHSYHTLTGHAAAASRLPFVYTPHYHGTGHTAFRAFLHRVYRPAGARQFRAADAVICVSAAERDLVRDAFPAAAPKLTVIPNGTGRGSPAGAADPPPPAAPVVLTVGRLERYKNVDLVIDAFRALPQPATLVVVGDGPDRARLEAHARPAGPGGIRFTGHIPDAELDRLLATATVVASASDHEAFGLTLADGLAAGARVVASAIPAHAELARRAGGDGPAAAVTLADPRDPAQFATALAASLRAGRVPAACCALPSWAAVAADTRDLYTRVLAGRAGGGPAPGLAPAPPRTGTPGGKPA